MKRSLLPLSGLLALALLATACQSGPDKTGTSTQGFYASSYDLLWDLSVEQLGRSGWATDSEESSREGKTMVTRWRTRLMPFAMRGWRDRATLVFHPVEGRPDYWTVEANVLRQTNTEEKEPANPVKAKWDKGVRVPEDETRLVHDIEMAFLSRDVSPEFRARYGMPSGPRPIPPPSTGMGDDKTAK